MNKDIIESNHWHFVLFFITHTHTHTHTHTNLYHLQNPEPTTHYLAYHLASNNLDIFCGVIRHTAEKAHTHTHTHQPFRVCENVRTAESNFTWFYHQPKRCRFMLRLIHSRVIFIAWGSVWDLPQAIWEGIYKGYLKTIMFLSWVKIFILFYRLVSWTTPPSIIPGDPHLLELANLLSLICQAGRCGASDGAWIDILVGPGVYPAEVNFDFRLCCGFTSFSPTGR